MSVLSMAGYGFCFRRLNFAFGFLAFCAARNGKSQTHPGATRPWAQSRCVAEFDTSPMIFEHATNDRETKTGALLAGGYIWLKQPRAVFFGQTYTVVHNINDNVVILSGGDDINSSALYFALRNGS